MVTCTISSCNEPARARGWCHKHWRFWKKYGNPLVRQRGFKYWTPEEDERLITLHQQQWGYEAIAHQLSRSKTSVANRVRRLMTTGALKPMKTPEQTARNAILAGYQHDSQKHGRQWLLTSDAFYSLIMNNCTYCGCPPSNGRAKFPGFVYTGIDRVNNEGDYTAENVVPCCSTCNYAKRFMDQDEFLAWIKRVYHHTNGHPN